MIKVGKVSSVDLKKGTVQVLLEDKDDMVSGNLPMLSFEFAMPKPNTQVLCVFLDNAPEQGFCLGEYYSDACLGVGQGVFRKRFDGNEIYLEFDPSTGGMFIKNTGGKVTIEASQVEIKGDLIVQGSIEATGSVLDVQGNSNHHAH